MGKKISNKDIENITYLCDVYISSDDKSGSIAIGCFEYEFDHFPNEADFLKEIQDKKIIKKNISSELYTNANIFGAIEVTALVCKPVVGDFRQRSFITVNNIRKKII